MPRVVRAAWCGLVLLTVLPASVRAGQVPADGDLPVVIRGPSPPQPPDVITRDENGRATVRAIRLDEPLRVDGTLDERVYRDVPALSDFIQTEPVEGALATEKSEAWVSDPNILGKQVLQAALALHRLERHRHGSVAELPKSNFNRHTVSPRSRCLHC